MAVITPQTDVYLLKVPLEIDDNNQLTFENTTAQFNYFNSLPKLEVTDFTYQRKDNTIRYGGNYDSLITYNYVMYRNDAYSNKWFYAFITDMEYLNDNVTAISIKEDCWQTWQFDLTFKPVLIDREHVNDDTIGKNTLPEGLELGEMVTNGPVRNFGFEHALSDTYYVAVIDVSMIENPGSDQTLQATWDSGSTPIPYANGMPSGVYHIVMGYNTTTVPNVRHLINIYNEAGLSDAIQNIYVLPQDVVGTLNTGLTLSTTGSAPADSISGLAMPTGGGQTVDYVGYAGYSRPTSIDGYIPKNNKLFCYPYNYLNVSNNAGTTIPYHYEDFSNPISGDVDFQIESVMTPSGSIKAVPRNYKNIEPEENAYDYSINGAKFPVCNWNSDSYTNWLTQNAVNMQVQWRQSIIGGAGDILGGAIAGATAGAGFGLVGAIPGAVAGAVMGSVGAGKGLISTAREQHLAKTEANMVPDQVRGNLGSGDIVFSKLRCKFTFLPMSIKKEYARCIDEFFSQYGYKCNRVKVPNITGRRNWNYVKTVGCYIDADIPQSSLAEIKALFDRGITFWHNPANFGNYNANNDII